MDDSKLRLMRELRQISNELRRLTDLANAKIKEIDAITGSPIPSERPVTESSVSRIGQTAPDPPQDSYARYTSPMQSTIHQRIPRQAPTTTHHDPRSMAEKQLTGIEKLDDLLGGGLRTSSNVLLSGPPFSGKETLAWNFLSVALREGTPVIIVTTDKSINDIKHELSRIVPGIEEAEASGMIKFVDVYSRSIQTQTQSKYAITIDNIINISSLFKAVDSTASQMLGVKPFYRLLFTSLTTYVNELDEKLMLKFVQQFAQKRKSENCTSLYLLESGLFDSKVIEAIAYLMDGSIGFRTDGSKHFLKVDGLGNVRSRDWVELFPSETSFELGAFTLEKIR